VAFQGARSEDATFPARLRGAAGSDGSGGAAREHNGPKSTGEPGGLGTCPQKQSFRARPRRAWRARPVAGQSRSRRLVADGERAGGESWPSTGQTRFRRLVAEWHGLQNLGTNLRRNPQQMESGFATFAERKATMPTPCGSGPTESEEGVRRGIVTGPSRSTRGTPLKLGLHLVSQFGHGRRDARLASRQ
jgi:hypothetical protein